MTEYFFLDFREKEEYLECTLEIGEERRFVLQREDAFLAHDAFDVVVFDNDVFFKSFDCVVFFVDFRLRQKDFSE